MLLYSKIHIIYFSGKGVIMKIVHKNVFSFVSLNNSSEAGFLHVPFIPVPLNVFDVFESLLKYLLWTICKKIFCPSPVSCLVHELEKSITNNICHPY